MDFIKLKAENRDSQGTKATRRLRAEGRLPAVIYGHGEAPESVSLDFHDALVSLQHGARILTVELKGRAKPCLIKDVQYDYLGTTPIHVDLARVDLDERVRVRVGIELRGTPKGLSEGGILEQFMADIEVECRVTDIPDTLHPIVNDLAVGQSLLVKDLPFPPGVTAVAGAEERVAMVRVLAEAPAAEPVVEGEEVAVEPERIGRVRKEEEGEEGAGT